MTTTTCRIAACAFFLTTAVTLAWGDEGDAEDRRAFLSEKFEQYRLFTRSRTRSRTPLRFDKEPLLRFANPISGVVEAAVFAWKDKDYPHAIGKIFLNERKKAWGEYVSSVTSTRMVMNQNDTVVWAPKPQSAFQRLDGFPPPSPSKVARKAQMRAIAKQFRVLDLWKEDPEISDTTVNDWTLRMLTTPLLRYDLASEGIVDGLVYAFVLGTNPEVLLSVEAKVADDSRTYWQYRFTRLTVYELKAYRGKKQVWTAKRMLDADMPKDMPSYHKWQTFDLYPFQPSQPVDGTVATEPAAY